jgi:hypothetical protein
VAHERGALDFETLIIFIDHPSHQPSGLRCSLCRSYTSVPPAYPNERNVLAPMAALCDQLATMHGLPLVQIWAPCLVSDDSQPPGQEAASFAALQCRGMPSSVTDPAAWALRVACCERALPPCASLPGGAWHSRSLLWASNGSALGNGRDPLRPFLRVAGLDDVGSIACCILPNGRDLQSVYVLHALVRIDSAEMRISGYS